MNGAMREINTNTTLIIDWISIICAYQGYYYGLNPVRELLKKLPGPLNRIVVPEILLV